MAVSEERVRAVLAGYVEPYLQQTLAQAGAVRAIRVQDEQIFAGIELGFPTVGYAHALVQVFGFGHGFRTSNGPSHADGRRWRGALKERRDGSRRGSN